MNLNTVSAEYFLWVLSVRVFKKRLCKSNLGHVKDAKCKSELECVFLMRDICNFFA